MPFRCLQVRHVFASSPRHRPPSHLWSDHDSDSNQSLVLGSIRPDDVHDAAGSCARSQPQLRPPLGGSGAVRCRVLAERSRHCRLRKDVRGASTNVWASSSAPVTSNFTIAHIISCVCFLSRSSRSSPACGQLDASLASWYGDALTQKVDSLSFVLTHSVSQHQSRWLPT